MEDNIEDFELKLVRKRMRERGFIEGEDFNIVTTSQRKGRVMDIYDQLAKAKRELNEVIGLADGRGQQIAALREALEKATRLVGAYNNELQRKGFTAEARQPTVAVLREARAALTDTAAAAAQYQLVPEGYVVAPVKATQEMANAGWAAIANNADDPQAAAWPIWQAMIAAAPHAGEGTETYRERYKRELIAAYPATPDPEDG